MMSIIEIKNLTKEYKRSTKALKNINLEIKTGELFALLGPNGAGKTTLINIICGLVNPSGGVVTIGGFDIINQYRQARALVSLVPQEIHLDPFITVEQTLEYTRGFFGKSKNVELTEQILKDLSLWDKKDSKVIQLSGGMKRRVLIAKALMNEPAVLFLDEPTAGVDVELRRDMWKFISKIKQSGSTIILTTHYLEEAEEMADRIGIIDKGELKIVEDKKILMQRMSKKQMQINLQKPLYDLPKELQLSNISLSQDKQTLTIEYGNGTADLDVADLMQTLKNNNISIGDVVTKQSSLEDIFIDLINK
ncbi:MAG: multidrug ABC transporter ATP-binding protein [Candidatus Magasanikbacteria bacterium CG_4_10_14_0_8_um_filter_32_14]|uniref:Multidrug ABC transporter ATP-binding protein n=2 Tax=Candidatus Magasanikiibacteriota TaxID=1752731 RepID=A0A2M7RA82_9BACT|nr:MAG: multidrug ABC transporter ATP-binding protein [Candidatus Magasanikbacteria bacterium CG1_02_32_51]PIY93471.1 MAG: multidrug ABC transporter ATP-binding protein [Candidatus Magasanikbacteria bacterium CG_4_10_14_0_8_um_filter_32_14]